MTNVPADHATELREIVEAKLTAMMMEMQQADWSAEEIAFAIDDVINEKWLAAARALRAARADTPDRFVSDGNEG